MFFYTGKATLILHDHKERVGGSNKERFILCLFKMFSWRFHKVIIHDNRDLSSRHLLKYKNIKYLQMPPHGFPAVNNESLYLPTNIDYEKINLLCFGRLEAYKNFEYFASVVKDIPYIRLTIAGSGIVSDELKSIIENSNNVTVINKYISDSDLCSLMRDHHYLVLPYKDITQTGLIELAGFFYKPLILSQIQAFKRRELDDFSIIISNSDKKETPDIIENIVNLSYLDYKTMCLSSRLNFESGMNLWEQYSKIVIK